MTRFAASAVVLLAATALLAGCASGPGDDAPTSTGEPAPGADEFGELEAAWLDDGRMLAVVTLGSSSCVPTVTEIAADGQTLTVTLEDDFGDDAICTADLAPRASLASVPEGVDPAQDVELVVSYGGAEETTDLDGDAALTGTPGTATEYGPTAGWFDDGGVVLLTWGSSSCGPLVEDVVGSGATGTVTFAEPDAEQMCTMDMAPRATMIHFGDDAVEDDGFELTLVGAGVDATIPVRG